MVDMIDDDDEEIYEVDPRDEKAVEVYERLEEELMPDDDSGHQRYSKRDVSTTDCRGDVG